MLTIDATSVADTRRNAVENSQAVACASRTADSKELLG